MTAVSDETVNYIARYGGMCRDCADEDGICPRSGLPCADRGKAICHVLEALSYGLEHGFIKSAALSAAPVGGPGDELRMLRERLGPRGLEVVQIEGRGHYVNEAVKAEIEKLRSADRYDHGYADGVEWAITRPPAPAVGGPLRRIVLDTLNAVAPAVENLSVHQEQCDRDGVMVKVSRQALDEVLNAVNEVAMQSAITASPDAPVNPETTIPGTDDMDKRFAWLEAKAIDMGYVLVPEPEHPDSPHAPVAQEPVATAPVSPDVWTRRVVREAMQDAWNDICHDTGCHPIDIRNVNGVVFFEPRHWAEQVASLLFARTVRDTLASTPPATPAGVGADEIARAVGKRLPDVDAAIKEAVDCITDLGSGKGGWAWEEVVQRLALLSRDKS